MINPTSTYRIQFHKDFSFQHFEAVLPYLHQLGISTIYASPIFQAVPGSVHGYDAINPLKINPEIGTEDDLRRISQRLKEYGMLWIQDIVPNHMAFDHRNPWLMDVLEKGQQSKYADFFDISWTSKLFKGQVMVPFLGSTLEEVIEKGELQLSYEQGRMVLKYYESFYPLHLRSYLKLFNTDPPNDAIKQLVKQIDAIHKIEDAEIISKNWDELLLQLSSLMKNEVVQKFVQQKIESVNNNKDLLKQIADDQVYRLCHWQETDSRINYRRFFT
ncbi:MAG TPA: alpha-amylase family glycosyl hydrolase, partial [Flavisolibacter sp.]|nr:alpha-amylase family glycosyl hydrolase [Flavisolibacter sp.]